MLHFIRTVCMSLSVTENVGGIAVSPLDKDDELVFLNSMAEDEVLIRSASVRPFGICILLVYKQLRWAWLKIINGIISLLHLQSLRLIAITYLPL